MTKELLPNDVLVRYDRADKSISFFTVRPGRDGPVPQLMHECSWDASVGIVGVTDIGGAIAGFFHTSHQDVFCTAEEWEKLAEEIRIAAGRDDEQ